MDEKVQYIREVVMLVVGSIATWLITNIRPKQVKEDEHDKSQNQTIEIQGRTLAGAWDMIEKLQKHSISQDAKIKELDDALVKYTRALNRAYRFIGEHVRGVQVPDFLLDTDPNIGKK